MIKRNRKTTRTTKKAMQNTEEIIHVILQLQAAGKSVTVSKITKCTGITRFSFYTRFHNPWHALEVWEEELLRQCEDYIKTSIPSGIAQKAELGHK